MTASIRDRVLLLLAVAVVVAMTFRPSLLGFQDHVHDSASYLGHAFTMGIDLDLDYGNEIFDERTVCRTPAKTACHPPGAGILAAPFVGAFSLIDRWTGAPVIGNRNEYALSWSYFGFLAAAATCFTLTLWILSDLARRVAPSLRRSHVALLVAGSGLLVYALHLYVMSHVFEVFVASATAWLPVVAWDRWRSGGRWAVPLALASAAAVFGHAVRPNDLNLVLVPVLVLATLFARDGQKPSLALAGRGLGALAAGAAIAAALLAALYFSMYGTVLPGLDDFYPPGYIPAAEIPRLGTLGAAFEYGMELLRRLRFLPGIAFSSEMGVAYSSPVLLFGIVCLAVALLRRRRLGAPALVAFLCLAAIAAIPVMTVLSMRTPGSSYGWRYLFSLIAPAVFGYALWYERAGEAEWKSRGAVHAAVCVLSLFALAAQASYFVSGLSAGVRMNIFQVVKNGSTRGVTDDLLVLLFSPTFWGYVADQRLPGLMRNIAVVPGIMVAQALLLFSALTASLTMIVGGDWWRRRWKAVAAFVVVLPVAGWTAHLISADLDGAVLSYRVEHGTSLLGRVRFKEGWGWPEAEHRWSDGGRAVLEFDPAPGGAPRERMVMTVTVITAGQQDVGISLNGQSLGRVSLREWFPGRELSLDVGGLVRAKSNVVEFDIPSPHVEGTRALGIGLVALKIVAK